MRRWWLAALPLFWSCADNQWDPAAVTPELSAIQVPDVIVAGWPVGLVFSTRATVPATGGWQVQLRVSGPGLDTPVDYALLDDGDFFLLESPGPGQESHSGDNVAGDGWFSTRLSADFSPGLGSYVFRARLLEDGIERDFRQVTRERVENRAPAILSIEAPSTLPSGSSFSVIMRVADPDGQDDLEIPSLRQSGGAARSWPFVQAGDSLWILTVGPELAAGRQGPDTLQAVAMDRVGHEVARTLAVDLENGPPMLVGDSLTFHLALENGGFQPLDMGDTIHLFVPSTDPADSNLYRMMIPAFDPQTLADITDVTWEITAVENPNQTQTQSMVDYDGTGVFEAGIKLNGRPVPYQFTVYFLRFRAYDLFHVSAVEERIIRIHNVNESPGGPGGWPRFLMGDASAGQLHPVPWRINGARAGR